MKSDAVRREELRIFKLRRASNEEEQDGKVSLKDQREKQLKEILSKIE